MSLNKERQKMQSEFSNLFFKVLNSGENIFWAGHPRQGIELNKYVLRGLIHAACLALLLFAYSMMMKVDQITIAAGSIVIIGMIFFSFYSDSWRRQKMWYAVTDQKLIIKKDKSKFELLEIDKIKNVKIKVGWNGQGELVVTKSHSFNESQELQCLQDVHLVYDEIQRSIQASNNKT